MDRRDFIRTVAAAAPALHYGQLYAAPMDSPRLLIVFLRGGYDCLNMLVPYSSADYYELRPTIAIPRPPVSLQLDADWALAPPLASTLSQLYASKQIAFVPFAGTEDLSRSHFETQDSIELGQPVDRQDLRSGFLARLAAVVNGHKAIAFTDSMPVCFRGGTDIPNISLRSLSKPAFDERQSAVLADMYAHHPLHAQVEEGLELRQQVSAAMADEMQQANRDAITAKGFELEAQRIGRLLRTDYAIGFVDVGGWDTHVNENGTLAANLDSVGHGLQALARELGDAWSNTTVIVLSEFGRTFRENGNRGTDHGHGSVYWIAGGAIAGGRIVGRQQRIQRATLLQDRDLPVLNDYRAVIGGLVQSMWNLSTAQMEQVFPAVTPLNLGLL
ncbi:MAG TPA: DUF1501 domain-containing protein [Steroidobacteraceae bacterium]|jgi:uncharacterized protein (DUF1501 family)